MRSKPLERGAHKDVLLQEAVDNLGVRFRVSVSTFAFRIVANVHGFWPVGIRSNCQQQNGRIHGVAVRCRPPLDQTIAG